MSKVKIITDSSSDFRLEQYEENDVECIPFLITLDGKRHLKELIDISADELYEMMLADPKLFPKTAYSALPEYMDCFRKHLSKGMDVFFLSMTANFSSLFQNLLIARDALLAEFPGRKIITYDSRTCAGGQALLLWKAIELRNSGHGAEEIEQRLDGFSESLDITFTVNTLEYLQKGGRIGALSAILGELLSIKPVIRLVNGEFHAIQKTIGRKKAIRAIIDTHFKLRPDVCGRDFIVIQSAARNEAEDTAAILENEFGAVFRYDRIISVGATIGVHIGPSVVGICSVKRG